MSSRARPIDGDRKEEYESNQKRQDNDRPRKEIGARAGSQKSNADSQEAAQQHEVREVREIDDVLAGESDERQLNEEHEKTEKDETPPVGHASVIGLVHSIILRVPGWRAPEICYNPGQWLNARIFCLGWRLPHLPGCRHERFGPRVPKSTRRVLWLRSASGEEIVAPFCVDGRTVYEPGYWQICFLMRDRHVPAKQGYVHDRHR